jgi:hypothetical protein
MLDLDAKVVGTEFRGAIQIAAFRFLATLDDVPVSIDGSTTTEKEPMDRSFMRCGT